MLVCFKEFVGDYGRNDNGSHVRLLGACIRSMENCAVFMTENKVLERFSVLKRRSEIVTSLFGCYCCRVSHYRLRILSGCSDLYGLSGEFSTFCHECIYFAV